MKNLKKYFLTITLIPVFSFANIEEIPNRNSSQGTYRNPEFQQYEEAGGAILYPEYIYPGGYLLPGPVDPGQDEADAIYRANQHPE